MSVSIYLQGLLIKFLQQLLPALTIETGCQAAFLNLLRFATEDAQLLCKGMEDFAWIMGFKEPISVWCVPVLTSNPQTWRPENLVWEKG